MVLHKDVALGNMHPPYNWVYADSADRLAATGFVSDDIGKLALQADNATLWILKDDSPETWGPVGEAVPAGSEGDIQFNQGGLFGASSVGLNWTEGSDETDSMLSVEGTLIVYSALVATNIGTPRVSSSGDLELAMIDALEINTDPGTSGQVLQSNGPGTPPTWEDQTGGSGYTDEEAQDAVGTILADSSSIDFTYTDGTPEITANVKDEYIQDTIGAILTDSTNIDFTYNDGSDQITADLTTQAKTFTINFLIDGAGSTIATGIKGLLIVDRPGAITKVTLVADQSGSIVLNIKKATYSGFPTVSSIVASAPPTLSTAQKSQDSTLSGWTTAIAAGDVFEVSVTSATSVQRVTLALTVVAS